MSAAKSASVKPVLDSAVYLSAVAVIMNAIASFIVCKRLKRSLVTEGSFPSEAVSLITNIASVTGSRDALSHAIITALPPRPRFFGTGILKSFTKVPLEGMLMYSIDVSKSVP